MANRVLLGNRATGGQGLYVSRAGDDVATTGNPLAFDSRSACTLLVHSFGQGIMQANTGQVNIVHNLGYAPAYAVRWCTSAEISSGVATAVYSPSYWEGEDIEEFNCEEEEEGYEECEESSFFLMQGLDASLGNQNSGFRLEMEAYIGGHDDGGESGNAATLNGRDVYYSYIIFKEPDFTEGESL